MKRYIPADGEPKSLRGAWIDEDGDEIEVTTLEDDTGEGIDVTTLDEEPQDD